MNAKSIRTKILILLAAVGLIGSIAFVTYSRVSHLSEVEKQAKASALNLIQRSVEMFIVSTEKFHEEFNQNRGDFASQTQSLVDWNRTIFAVDEAVTADHGPDKPRVRLIGDAELFDMVPMGGQNTAILDDFERRSAEKIVSGAEIIEEYDDNIYKLSLPLRSSAHPGCAECHIATAKGLDQDFNQDLLLGTLNAYVPTGDLVANAESQIRNGSMFLVICIIVLIALIFFYLSRSVLKPLATISKKIVKISKDFSSGNGDLTERLEVVKDDEIGEVSSSLNQMLEELRVGFSEIKDCAEKVKSSSGNLKSVSTKLLENSHKSSEISDKFGEFTQNNSQGVSDVMGLVESTSENLRSIATASEQMSATIEEISKNTDKGRTVAELAVDKVSKSNQSMEHLGEAANLIGNVTETIKSISEQTNLLALNATIEAASAGEAGKGFAVVANEIKELSRQTASATEKISSSITNIQENTSISITEIEGVSEVIQEMAEITSVIAASIEEQSATTFEISDNVNKTSGQFEIVNSKFVEISDATSKNADEVMLVKANSNSIAEISSLVGNHADSLSTSALALTEVSDKYKV